MRRIAFALCALAMMSTACSKAKKKAADDDTKVEPDEKTAHPTEGFTDDKIYLGMCSTFRGPEAGMGTEMYRGLMSYLLEVNASGGVNGRTFEISTEDVGYDKDRAQECAAKMMQEKPPLAFVLASASPVIAGMTTAWEKEMDKEWFILGAILGPGLYRVPGSAKEMGVGRGTMSTRDITGAFTEAGGKNFGILYEDSSTGTNVRNAVLAAMTEKGLKPALELQVSGKARFDTDNFKEQVQKFRAANVDGIYVAGTYQKVATLARDAREAGWNVPIAGAAVPPDTIFRLLQGHERQTGKRVSNAVLGVTFFPPPTLDQNFPAAIEFRELMEKRNPALPETMRDPNYRTLPISVNGFDGYLAGKVLVEGVRRVGRDISRAKVRAAIAGIKDWDIGGVKFNFGENGQPILTKGYLVGTTPNGFGVVTDMKKYLASSVDATGQAWGAIKKGEAAPGASGAASAAAGPSAVPAGKTVAAGGKK